MTEIVAVVGLGKKDRALGYKNKLLWHVPADLKRFKQLTMGHPVIMGRKTFESILDILGKPFPGRTNIVLSSDKNYSPEGVKVCDSLAAAIELAKEENPSEIHIGGGAKLYEQIFPQISRLYVTWFYAEKEADAFFPEFEKEFNITNESPVMEHEGIRFQWVDYERKRS